MPGVAETRAAPELEIDWRGPNDLLISTGRLLGITSLRLGRRS